MRIVSVVGARPQFVKLAPISHMFASGNIEHVIVHTGQHYDPEMSDSFFDNLNIPRPDFNLGIGSGSHAKQTGSMLEPLEKVFLDINPDWVLAYGDTNSTLATAISSVKIHKRLAHLESGLRSFNRSMPEEHNRILTDHASDLLLAPTKIAMEHLSREGLSDRSILVGDVMTDVCLQIARDSDGELNLPDGIRTGKYYLATIHRAENTDNEHRLANIIGTLSAMDFPVVLTVHPRLSSRARGFGIALDSGSLIPVRPLSYPEMVSATAQARGVITDSGGLQKEAFLVQTPCVTLRTETEWAETVEMGVNLVDANATSNNIIDFINDLDGTTWPTIMPYGTGDASLHVMNALLTR